MYKCWNCGQEFDEPASRNESYESYYGVGSWFPDHHYFTFVSCPFCDSEDFEEVEDEEEDEEEE